MDKAEFDRVADEYMALHANNISASGESPEFFARYKIQDVADSVSREGLDVRRIVDFGSGIGNSLPHFAELFPEADITCADVSTRSLEISRSRFPDITATHTEIEGLGLPFENGSFDLAFSACVFHHIPAAEHVGWFAELKRITVKGGALFIFEHNPLNPLTLSAVRNCPFDENAVLIGAGELRRRIEQAGWKQARIIYRIFFPHMLAFARPLETWLTKLPLGAQYFVMARNS
ncbi:MAG TPA: class I SAM-dependent methyltransferase [Methylophilaceae bacterium]|nr:class I SAM-dependent methyltransferase [Methylophilaceae bacterium]